MTTTGATVLSGLEDLPKGLLMWRGILQWLGGIGIIVVAMVFLPELKVGGMQILKSEGFDTFGKILPRAGQIATQISVIYIWLTLACMMSYLAVGMEVFDATVHALTTIATGGFSNYDASFRILGLCGICCINLYDPRSIAICTLRTVAERERVGVAPRPSGTRFSGDLSDHCGANVCLAAAGFSQLMGAELP